MKIIEYKVSGYSSIYNPETKEVELKESVAKAISKCHNQTEFDSAYAIAEKEAIEGTIEVTGEFEPEEDTATTDEVLNTLLGVY